MSAGLAMLLKRGWQCCRGLNVTAGSCLNVSHIAPDRQEMQYEKVLNVLTTMSHQYGQETRSPESPVIGAQQDGAAENARRGGGMNLFAHDITAVHMSVVSF